MASGREKTRSPASSKLSWSAGEKTAEELSRPELDPARMEELLKRREEAFAALQEAYASALESGALEEQGAAGAPELRELVDELLAS